MLSAPPQGIPLPGRRLECERLTALMSDIAAGSGGALVFHGDAGVGKSALVRFGVAEAIGFTVVAFDGHEAEAGVSFAALHQILHLLTEHVPGQLSEPARELAQALEQGTVGGLALRATVLRLFRQAARDSPLLFAVDDAHWLDEPSLEVLVFVARRVRSDRIGLLFAYCDEGRGGKAISGVPAHRLGPLDEQASREVLQTTGAAVGVCAVLVESAKGNPRALIDLATSLTPDQIRGDQPAPGTLPSESGLRGSYRDRLGRLPAQARWLVLLAAADDQADVNTLARAAAASAVDIAALEPAEKAGIIRVEGTTLSFPQPLLSSVAYNEATLAQRRAAHRCLAQAVDRRTDPLRHALHRAATADSPDDELAAELEQTAAEPTQCHAMSSRALERAADLTTDPVTAAGRLVAAAHHAWQAGEPNRARTLLRQVAATPVSDVIQAQSRILTGEIELRAGAARTAQHMLLTAAGDLADHNRYLALGAFIRAGEALCLSGGHARYPDIAQRALALRRPEEPPDVESMFDHFATLSATFRGEHRRAISLSRRMFARAASLNDVGTLTRTSMAAIFRGDEAQAYALASKAARIAQTDGDVPAVPQAMEIAALAEFLLGRCDNPATGLEGLRLARQSGQDNLAGNYLALLAGLAAMTGDRHTCLLRLRQAATHPRGPGSGRATAIGHWALAVLDLADGKYADVVTHLCRIITNGSGNGHLIVQVGATPHLVEAAARCERRAIAIDALRVYDSWATSTGSPHWLALSARCHALLADNMDDAETHFVDAMAHHTLSTNEFEHARTGLLFGRHLRRRRKPKAAREFLHNALSTFERFDARPWADQAAAELRAAGQPVPSRAGSITETLTPHQSQIAHLVAEGATNREVAARMLISTRTVDHHMRNIFAKLGVRSRVELAKLMT
ncbi:helix-turn-helix transcriptional regulator [Kibdelosporangium aridum]|uniref:helix-turn-helix transcriptional regulator n=1 Tax=Kibdelosporangium aridum TaxID=2030 RepID=UPI00117BCA3B|nr:LuxR family transcriptional regulator [Kibdelosporangium aridum]